jgi:hypothetical protein
LTAPSTFTFDASGAQIRNGIGSQEHGGWKHIRVMSADQFQSRERGNPVVVPTPFSNGVFCCKNTDEI